MRRLRSLLLFFTEYFFHPLFITCDHLIQHFIFINVKIIQKRQQRKQEVSCFLPDFFAGMQFLQAVVT